MLTGDFANHLGDDLQAAAADINQRFGNQPLSTFVKSWKDGQDLISQGGKVEGYPAEDATPTAVQRWNSGNAVPDEASAYQLFDGDPPEGINTEAVGMFQELFKATGTPPALARKISDGYQKIEADFAKRASDIYEAGLREKEAELRKELGPEYEDSMKALKGVLASQGMDPSDTTIFDNPDTIRFGLKVMGMLGEDTVASLRSNAASAGAFGRDAKTEAMAVINDSSHPDHAAYNRGDREVVARVVRGLGGNPEDYSI